MTCNYRSYSGIYALSAHPGTRVFNNYINHLFNDNGALYPDQGASNMRWHSNVLNNIGHLWLNMWTSSIQYDTIENNYYSNSNSYNQSSNCIVRNNTYVTNNTWPQAALTIMQQAGRVLSPTGVVKKNIRNYIDSPELMAMQNGDRLNILFDGDHSVDIFSCTGRKVQSFKGQGIAEYRLNKDVLVMGLYVVRVSAEKSRMVKNMVLTVR